MHSRLPYPGYSWSLTQHMGRATAKTLYQLLYAGYIFSGQPDFRKLVANHLYNENILTQNQRGDSGQADAWRDYQQLLSELGLIVSTKYTSGNVVITPLGLLWLDGSIGYSELMTTQALKYQYPNGMKQDIQTRMHDHLVASSLPIAESRAQVDTIYGVRIKPSVLIFRILLKLYETKISSCEVTVQECVNFLIPLKNNYDWQQGYNDILESRRNNRQLDIDLTLKRHVQEWFSFLSYTDLCYIVGRGRDVITLSPVAIENIPQLKELCDYHEDSNNFWMPTSDDRNQIAFSWFGYFGNATPSEQWFNENPTEDYIEENYVKGIQKADEILGKQPDIVLQPYVPHTPIFSSKPQINFDRIQIGHIQREQNTKLHENIVSFLANTLLNLGYDLKEDPNSVDLIASDEGNETIFEVKTITKKNLYPRLRLGIGQLSEYRFRRQQQTASRPNGILVISSKAQIPEWLITYMQDDIHIGLICLTNLYEFKSYTSGYLENTLTNSR